MVGKTEPIDIFFEMPLNKWAIFDSKTLANSKVVLLQDLKPVVDMFHAGGVASASVPRPKSSANLASTNTTAAAWWRL